MIMKKHWKKLLLIILVMGMVLLISGCDGAVETHSEVTIQKDWSGARNIYARLSRSALQSKAKLTVSSLDKIIRSSCPSEIAWKRTSSGSDYLYTFTVKFDSMDQYKEKIAAILDGQDPKEEQSDGSDRVQIEIRDSLYEEGFSIKEDFVSSDLLGWLKKAIQKGEKISDSNMEQLFEETESTLIYNGKTIKSGKTGINYSNFSTVIFERIDYQTVLTAEELWNRRIRWEIDMDGISDDKQEEIRQHFADILPENVEGEWSEDENTVYEIRAGGLNEEQLLAVTRAVMETQSSQWNEKGSSDGLFQFTNEYKENVDLTAFLTGDEQDIPFTYYLKDERGREISVVENTEEGSETDGGIQEGYETVYADSISQAEVSFSISNIYTIKEIHVTTDVGWKDKFKRAVELYYDRVPQQKEREAALASLTQAAGDSSSVTIKPEEGEFVLSVESSGNATELADAFTKVFKDSSSIHYGQDYMGLFRFSIPYVFKEEVKFDQFLSQDTPPEIFYHTNFLNGESLSADDMKKVGGTISADGKSYDETVNGSNYSVQVVTVQKSYLPVFLCVILFVLIVTVLFVIYRIIKEQERKRASVQADASNIDQFQHDWGEDSYRSQEYHSSIYDEGEDFSSALDEEEEKKAEELEKEIQQSLADEIEKNFTGFQKEDMGEESSAKHYSKRDDFEGDGFGEDTSKKEL